MGLLTAGRIHSVHREPRRAEAVDDRKIPSLRAKVDDGTHPGEQCVEGAFVWTQSAETTERLKSIGGDDRLPTST